MGDEGTKYTNDPNDKGGPTKFGITLRVYRSFYNMDATAEDIQNMTVDKAKNLYLTLYWLELNCDKILNDPIAIAIFDTAVLYGPGTSARLAQKTVNAIGLFLKVDGDLGDESVTKLNQLKGDEFIDVFRGLVLNRITEVVSKIPTDKEYEAGWSKRADRLLTLNDNNFLIKLSNEIV